MTACRGGGGVAEAWKNRIAGYGEEAPDQLAANPRNWRLHPRHQQDALRGSLTELGWIQDVIVNRATGYVLDGHARVALALRHDQPTVPVKYVELSDAEEALALTTLDPISALAGADAAQLDALLADVATEDAGLLGLLDELRAEHGIEADPAAGLADSDEVPAPPAEPTTRPGDLWLLGEHRLLCGDATILADVERLLAGERAAMLWTDPPYGVNYVGKTKDALTIRNDGPDGLAQLLHDAFTNAAVVLIEGAAFYVARPAGALSVTFGNAILGAGWRLHEELQWVKDAMVLGHSDYHLKHETIVFGYLPGGGRRGRGGDGWYGDNSQTSVFEVPRPKASPDHPTGKPVGLIAPHVRNSSRPGDWVLDCFGGSGSTLIACAQTGRRCATLELDPRYCDVIVERWERFTGKQAERERRAEAAD